MFDEQNAVRDFIRDTLSRMGGGTQRVVREQPPVYDRRPVDLAGFLTDWRFVPGKELPRQETEVLLEGELHTALVRINPSIAEQPERADEVLYRLRTLLLGVRPDDLVARNEDFTTALREGLNMQFGPNNTFVTVYPIDFERPENNDYVVATEVTFGPPEKRFDVVLFVNGIPLVVGEAKTATRPAVSWVDGAHQVYNDYERSTPAFFVPNVFSFASEGKTFRYGSVRMPLDLWAPWRDPDLPGLSGLSEVEIAARSLLRPGTVLDILRHFTVFATDKDHRKIKIICRYQQYQATNQIVQRVVQGRIRKGLIWHFQGSGKSLLMVFAALKLRHEPALKNPTVLIVVDRVDLDTQITGTFTAADVPNMVTADSRAALQAMLRADTRKVIVTTIHKFGEASGVLNERDNIIALVDEAHRTQEGDLGRAMRDALPNAFLFGLTGTPINRRDRNTFWAFGAEEDENGYLSRYSFEESIRDEATLPLHFEPRLVELRVDQEAIDEAYENLTGHLSEEDQSTLATHAARMAVLVKAPERLQRITRDIVDHYTQHVEPNGFKAMIVTFDRESCVLYKAELDKLLPPEASDVVMSVAPRETEWRQYDRPKDEEEALLTNFRDPAHPLRFLIVTARLLTGFDAPILQAMYLDKPMKEHNLLQAICRVNRPYPGKSHGIIVDYLGIFDDVAKVLDFDERSIQNVISNIAELREQLPPAVEACLAFFPDVDRSIGGWEGLVAAQQCVPDNESRDAFAREYSILSQLWEALSPDAVLEPYQRDYVWLSQVYQSLRPPSGHGKLLWHTLGAKTLEIIQENIHVESVRDDLETLVMDADVLEEIVTTRDPEQKARELELKITARLHKHPSNPVFRALGERMEELRQRHAEGLLTSLSFLKLLIELAQDTVKAEKEIPPEEEPDRGKAALTALFENVRNGDTPIIVERIVNEIDDQIVRQVRFDGWQNTHQGDRLVRQALRRVLLKYKLHHDQELFDKAYGYIREYY